MRARYGRTLFGSCLLTARKLVEAGVKFVAVTTESQYAGGVGAGWWDTHSHNFALLRNFNLPTLDQIYSALVDDLHDRGASPFADVFAVSRHARGNTATDPDETRRVLAVIATEILRTAVPEYSRA